MYLCAASQQLTEEDLNTIQAFTLKVHDHLLDKTYKKFPYVLPPVLLPSIHKSRCCLEHLAGFKAVLYDCCPNNCMCYTRPHNILDHCLYCKGLNEMQLAKSVKNSNISHLSLIFEHPMPVNCGHSKCITVVTGSLRGSDPIA